MKKTPDPTNTSQEYWEDVLSQRGDNMARGGRGDPRHHAAVVAYLENQKIQALEAEDLEEIKDGFDLAVSTVRQIKEESESGLHQTRPGGTDLRRLLTQVDYGDQFIRGHAESTGVFDSRTYETPELFYSDAELKKFLKQMFPLANTVDRKCNCERCVFPDGKTGKHPRSAQGCDCRPCKQTMASAKWLVVIKRWFLEHLSDTVVETQYRWEPGACGSLVQKIRKAVAEYERDMSLKTNQISKEIDDSDNSSALDGGEERHEASLPLVEVGLSS